MHRTAPAMPSVGRTSSRAERLATNTTDNQSPANVMLLPTTTTTNSKCNVTTTTNDNCVTTNATNSITNDNRKTHTNTKRQHAYWEDCRLVIILIILLLLLLIL